MGKIILPDTGDLTGRMFGRLTVTQRLPSARDAKWQVLCECGAIKAVYGKHLRNGRTKSCGCLARQQSAERNRANALPVAVRLERLIERIPFAGCWIWMGSIDKDGYGSFEGTTAHRKAYELQCGPVPNGLELDHLCRNPWCVNPLHLEPVTHRENILRSSNHVAANVLKAHCPLGHLLEQTRDGTRRRCRICDRAANKRSYQKRKASNASGART